MSVAPSYRALLNVQPSLTRALGRWTGEPVALLLLAQEQDPHRAPPPLLRLAPGEPWLRREVLLCGRRSQRVYAHARSQIAHDRLPGAFRRRLIACRLPMGAFWDLLAGRISREKLGVENGRVGSLGRYFGLRPGAAVVTRRYRVRLRGRPVMVITETIDWGKIFGGADVNAWSRSRSWPPPERRPRR